MLALLSRAASQMPPPALDILGLWACWDVCAVLSHGHGAVHHDLSSTCSSFSHIRELSSRFEIALINTQTARPFLSAVKIEMNKQIHIKLTKHALHGTAELSSGPARRERSWIAPHSSKQPRALERLRWKGSRDSGNRPSN